MSNEINEINETGIVIKDLDVILNEVKETLKSIYGIDINLEQNSPDGQFVNIFSQEVRDLLEKIVDVYNSFDPDSAVGVSLDARCAINNIQRQGASYTYTNIDIEVSKALTLQGIDNIDLPSDEIGSDVFTISDESGNEFVLVSTTIFTGAGTTIHSFRAKNIGQVITTIGTINNMVSVIDGVESVNNPASAVITGIDEETDTQLRLRRQNSIYINSNGFKESIISNILNLDEVQDVKVIENKTSAVDIYGVPAHSIWVIVLGGDSTEIANVIYSQRYGGGTYGDETVTITEIDNNEVDINFDYAINEDLYIKFQIEKLIGDTTIDFDYIKEQLVEKINYKIGQIANKSLIEKIVLDIIDNVYVKDLQISVDDISYFDTLETSTIQHRFVLDTTRMDISYV
ncbi:hypothetical protein EOM39_01370 [Candidatus Gracilibacteria bacterium]|nr:hypothetical protein [Candidatus Gracilibacteria bacterium]